MATANWGWITERSSFIVRAVGVTVGLQGFAALSSGGGFSDRTMHEVRARLDYTTGRIRPAIGFAYPLDEHLRAILDGVLQLGLQIGT